MKTGSVVSRYFISILRRTITEMKTGSVCCVHTSVLYYDSLRTITDMKTGTVVSPYFISVLRQFKDSYRHEDRHCCVSILHFCIKTVQGLLQK